MMSTPTFAALARVAADLCLIMLETHREEDTDTANSLTMIIEALRALLKQNEDKHENSPIR